MDRRARGSWGREGERGRESLVTGGSLTPPRGGCSGRPDSLPALGGSSFPGGAEIPTPGRQRLHLPQTVSQPLPVTHSLTHSLIHSLSKYLFTHPVC